MKPERGFPAGTDSGEHDRAGGRPITYRVVPVAPPTSARPAPCR